LPQTQVSWFYLPENAASSCYTGYHLHVASPIKHIKPIVQSWAQTSKCAAERLPYQFLGSHLKSSAPTNRLSCSISAASCFSVKSAACSLLNAPANTPSSAFSYTPYHPHRCQETMSSFGDTQPSRGCNIELNKLHYNVETFLCVMWGPERALPNSCESKGQRAFSTPSTVTVATPRPWSNSCKLPCTEPTVHIEGIQNTSFLRHRSSSSWTNKSHMIIWSRRSHSEKYNYRNSTCTV
jgi:hypothetical protein